MSEEKQLMVSIRCTTYNHESYIRQCLEGFVMQKTNFKFEAIVHDDASTDGTAAIIREFAEKYPDIIKPIYETENQYSKHDGSLRRIMDSHMSGKYVALCEGDDYWIDPLKLQKQVDFMEANPEFGMIHTNYSVVNSGSAKIGKINHIYPSGNIFSYIVESKYHIATMTVVFRKEIFDNLTHYYYDHPFMMGDLPLWIEISHESKIQYINDNTSVYRTNDNSASHSQNIYREISFLKNALECRLYYANIYNYSINVSSLTAGFYNTIVKLGYMKKRTDIVKEYYGKLIQLGVRIPYKTKLFYFGSYSIIGRWFISCLYWIMK